MPRYKCIPGTIVTAPWKAPVRRAGAAGKRGLLGLSAPASPDPRADPTGGPVGIGPGPVCGLWPTGTEAVTTAWENYAAHDPASEEAAAALMSAYAILGRRHLAARAYGRCRDGLKELGLEHAN